MRYPVFLTLLFLTSCVSLAGTSDEGQPDAGAQDTGGSDPGAPDGSSAGDLDPAAGSGGGVAVGIADSEAATFASSLWPGLGVIRLRVIVPYDVALRPPTDPRRQRFDAWLAAAPATASLNVGLQRINERDHPGYGHAPDEAHYRAAFRAFVAAYHDQLHRMRIDPWNEPNFNPGNGSRPLLPGGTYYLDNPEGGCGRARPTVADCGPRMAAYYYRWAEVDCPDCLLEAGEFAGTQGWLYVQRYKQHLGPHRPRVWGVHNYADVIRFQVSHVHRPAELNNFLRELYCEAGSHCNSHTRWTSGVLWVTATGANYSLACAGHPGLHCADGHFRVLGEASQCDAAAFILRFANVDRRITRIYFYTFMDGSNPRSSDDTGIVDPDGLAPRKAYRVIKNRATRCSF